MKLILASASPRRAELLRQIGVSFVVCPADADETIDEALSPAETVITLSRRKAQAVRNACGIADDKAFAELPILAADTLVEAGGHLLGKPKDQADAFSILSSLSGKIHRVHTGMTVILRGKTVSRACSAEVVFRSLSDADIRAYIATGEPLDKAGAYGIQGIGALLVKEIRGDYTNVVGLPLSALGEMMTEEFGLTLAEFLQ